MNSINHLAELIAFPTVSRDSNLDAIRYLVQQFEPHGIRCQAIYNQDRTKANLLAKVGPGGPGFLLSGHSDVVPIDGQEWTSDPFTLTQRGDRLFGRGTADMKGFVACATAALIQASKRSLKTPLWLAVSHDEEIGCVGVRSLLETMRLAPVKPLCCLVGEPTSMQVATGHKGKHFLQARCQGQSAHTALAPKALNALHLACELVSAIRHQQAELALHGVSDESYDIPYTTVHVARIDGGVALNIVPETSTVTFEIRYIPQEDGQGILARLKSQAQKLVETYKSGFPEAHIEFATLNHYPGLATGNDEPFVDFVNSLGPTNGTIKVSFGTEGGLFSQELDVPTVICGPGSMEQGHKADEFITTDQIEQCDRVLSCLVDRLASGMPDLSRV